MTVNDVYNYIDGFAPFASAAPWDNSGLLIGDLHAGVQKAFVALDVTPAVVREAAALGAQLIVSHHPVIFHPLRQIAFDSVQAKLLQTGISVLCAHTNYDKATGGVNDVLCDTLGLPFQKAAPDIAEGFLNLCVSEPCLSPAAFASLVAKKLKARVSYYPSGGTVSKIAVCAGAGSDFLKEAAALGCDAYLTGEASHHDYLTAAEAGITMFAAGHYETEFPAVLSLYDRLRTAFPDAVFIAEERAASFLTVV